MRARKGFLVVFEGTDGTGKSTQLSLLAASLTALGYDLVTTREPTDGQYGQEIRKLYTERETASPERELELFLADRKEHVENFILPQLAANRVILCDRYFLSTVAYQGALGFSPEELLARHAFAPDPDLALLLHTPVETGQGRIVSGRNQELNDFEKKDYLERVAKIFFSIKRDYIVAVDASESVARVEEKIFALVTAKLDKLQLARRTP